MTEEQAEFSDLVNLKGEVYAIRTLEALEEAARHKLMDDYLRKPLDERWRVSLEILGKA